MKLIIFDLDQTLVDFLQVHNDTVHQLFSDVFHVNAWLSEIDYDGRSLTENMVSLARLKGIREEAVTSRKEELLDRYEKIFVSKMPDDVAKHILPGAREILDRLADDSHITVLYTGDSPGITNIVLSATGLAKYFKVAVYGTETKSRLDMARLAIKEAEELTKRKFEGKDIVIIGDSIRDVECGRQLNTFTVAVATGFHSMSDLKREKPDFVTKDLRNTNKLLSIIG